MSHRNDAPFPWLYRGIWGGLVRWFQVPDTPPTIPATEDEAIKVFRAAPGYLKYRRVGYWIGFWVMLAVWVIGLGVLVVLVPTLGIVLAIPAIALFACLAALNYVALYLDYDTTWYAVGPNSLRTREGVWQNREITINYDNVQNVSTSQGPLQRMYGISDVRVETAGLTSGGGNNQPARAAGVSLKGMDNAEEIKALIQARCDASPTTGLGEDAQPATAAQGAGWPDTHLAMLREIRDAAVAFKG